MRVDDSASTGEDTTVTIDVLGNDTDIDDGLDPASVTVTGDPGNGTTGVNPDGSIDYTPDAGWSGSDSFTYEVCDFTGLCDSATVDITVSAVNDPPDAQDDAGAGVWGVDIDVDVLANDSDPDGTLDDTSVAVVSGPSDGATTVNPDGSITYVADDGFVRHRQLRLRGVRRRDAGQVRHRDGDASPSSANQGPDAVDDSATLDEDTGPVDDRRAGQRLRSRGRSAVGDGRGTAGHGTVVVNPDGSIDYTPDPDWSGTDTFTYTVCDVAGNCSTATVTVTVDPVNDGPTARDDAGTVRQGRTVTVAVLGNDTDSDGTLDPATVTVTTGPGHGSDDGQRRRQRSTSRPTPATPAPTRSSTRSATTARRWRATPPPSASTVTAVNRPPVAVDDVRDHAEDPPVTIDPRNNDTDPDGDVLTISRDSRPGTVTMRSDGRIWYSSPTPTGSAPTPSPTRSATLTVGATRPR